MNRYITELIGTFFLVLAVLLGGHPLTAAAALVVLVYMGGHISGAHYNPAVTISLMLRGKFGKADVVPYIAFQFVGAAAAGLVALWFAGSAKVVGPPGDVDVAKALGGEVLFTCALVLVILNVACTKATEGNSYYGLAIGLTIFAGGTIVGKWSGGVFNPAVGIGPDLAAVLDGKTSGIENFWLYIVGPLAGGILGSSIYALQMGEEA